MDVEIFKDEKEKAQAAHLLPELMKHEGWKFLDAALDQNIIHFTKQLRDRRDFTSLEEVYRLQDRLDDFEGFKNLPKLLLLDTLPDPPEDNPDPY